MAVYFRELTLFPARYVRGVRTLFSSSFLSQNEPSYNAGLASNIQPNDERNASKAMKAYLERAKNHDNFIKQQLHEYNIGKRHLANMMGKDPEFFTQEDVDEAIRYLFPSGLHDKRARPMMKHPDEIYPKQKDAEFDFSGRPFHSFFYTSKPNFFKLLHNTAIKFKELNKYEDLMISRGNYEEKVNDVYLFGSDWLAKDKIEGILLETLTDSQYSTLVKTFERLSQHPYSNKEKEFLMKFRYQLTSQNQIQEIPELTYDESKRPFVTFTSRRKRSNSSVKVVGQGTGLISINGKDIHYFNIKQAKEQIIFPLQFSEQLGKVDVVATVEGGGPSGQAGAIRYGISMCLRSFVDADMTEKMRLAGLLSFDPRTAERKKPGQAGARKKFTWKKR